MDKRDIFPLNKCTSFSSERESIVLQWAFKLNSYLAAANTWHLEGSMLMVKIVMLGICSTKPEI
jgi:hypothetical protein